jgi:hypothetical protein
MMGQLGHREPNFTLRVYAQQMARRDGERERLEALVQGRDFWAQMGTNRDSEGAADPGARVRRNKKPAR